MKFVEKYIFTHSFECYMYFTEEDDELTNVYNTIIHNNDNVFKLIGKIQLSKPIKVNELYSFQGWLSGNSNTNNELPTIAIISHYDTLSLLPVFIILFRLIIVVYQQVVVVQLVY